MRKERICRTSSGKFWRVTYFVLLQLLCLQRSDAQVQSHIDKPRHVEAMLHWQYSKNHRKLLYVNHCGVIIFTSSSLWSLTKSLIKGDGAIGVGVELVEECLHGIFVHGLKKKWPKEPNTQSCLHPTLLPQYGQFDKY